MDAVLSDAKIYENIAALKTIGYDEVSRALSVVRDYIIEHRLILYGGLAIHLALRARNHPGIYNDDVLPDYDCVTPDFYRHSNDLAIRLQAAGFAEAHTISAIHPATRRVRIGFVTVADISYMAPDIYAVLPSGLSGLGRPHGPNNTRQSHGSDNSGLGRPHGPNRKSHGSDISGPGRSHNADSQKSHGSDIRIIDMSYQIIDIHRSLSTIYLQAPTETFFQRVKKDIKRFKLINEVYPVIPQISLSEAIPGAFVAVPVVVPKTGRLYISGLLAYGIIFSLLDRMLDHLVKTGVLSVKPKYDNICTIHLDGGKIYMPESLTKIYKNDYIVGTGDIDSVLIAIGTKPGDRAITMRRAYGDFIDQVSYEFGPHRLHELESGVLSVYRFDKIIAFAKSRGWSDIAELCCGFGHQHDFSGKQTRSSPGGDPGGDPEIVQPSYLLMSFAQKKFAQPELRDVYDHLYVSMQNIVSIAESVVMELKNNDLGPGIFHNMPFFISSDHSESFPDFGTVLSQLENINKHYEVPDYVRYMPTPRFFPEKSPEYEDFVITSDNPLFNNAGQIVKSDPPMKLKYLIDKYNRSVQLRK